ncbi:hypothetical protein [Curtobacterium sp. UCD-KPL2560]|uniref:hypothetical protein n=1 Tax=Curtobacterium sp. UCD-KPL2560 TaxID=1885315 RepID=UPI0008258807|nr:hypothetical protein [Curtobacterium sp. UCD-KPL2560]
MTIPTTRRPHRAAVVLFGAALTCSVAAPLLASPAAHAAAATSDLRAPSIARVDGRTPVAYDHEGRPIYTVDTRSFAIRGITDAGELTVHDTDGNTVCETEVSGPRGLFSCDVTDLPGGDHVLVATVTDADGATADSDDFVVESYAPEDGGPSEGDGGTGTEPVVATPTPGVVDAGFTPEVGAPRPDTVTVVDTAPAAQLGYTRVTLGGTPGDTVDLYRDGVRSLHGTFGNDGRLSGDVYLPHGETKAFTAIIHRGETERTESLEITSAATAPREAKPFELVETGLVDGQTQVVLRGEPGLRCEVRASGISGKESGTVPADGLVSLRYELAVGSSTHLSTLVFGDTGVESAGFDVASAAQPEPVTAVEAPDAVDAGFTPGVADEVSEPTLQATVAQTSPFFGGSATVRLHDAKVADSEDLDGYGFTVFVDGVGTIFGSINAAGNGTLNLRNLGQGEHSVELRDDSGAVLTSFVVTI